MRGVGFEAGRVWVLGALSLVLFQFESASFPFIGVLAWLFVVVILYSLLCSLGAQLWMRWSETFSTEHPVKGSFIQRRLHLSNEGPLPFGEVRVLTRRDHSAAGLDEKRVGLCLSPWASQVWVDDFPCRLRGVYTLGLKEIRYTDPLGILTLIFHQEPRTFYVYPRVVDLGSLSLSQGRPSLKDPGRGRDAVEPGTVETLREYRPGDDVRGMDHRRFAASGRIFLRQPERRAHRVSTWLLDLGRSLEPSLEVLEAEDELMDAAFSLLNHDAKQGIPFSLLAFSHEPRVFQGRSSREFVKFWQQSLTLEFGRDRPSPLAQEAVFRSLGVLPSDGYRVLTSRFQPEFFDRYHSPGAVVPSVVAVVSSWSSEDRRRAEVLAVRFPQAVSLIERAEDLVGRSL